MKLHEYRVTLYGSDEHGHGREESFTYAGPVEDVYRVVVESVHYVTEFDLHPESYDEVEAA
jgi:hypothetical protein